MSHISCILLVRMALTLSFGSCTLLLLRALLYFSSSNSNRLGCLTRSCSCRIYAVCNRLPYGQGCLQPCVVREDSSSKMCWTTDILLTKGRTRHRILKKYTTAGLSSLDVRGFAHSIEWPSKCVLNKRVSYNIRWPEQDTHTHKHTRRRTRTHARIHSFVPVQRKASQSTFDAGSIVPTLYHSRPSALGGRETRPAPAVTCKTAAPTITNAQELLCRSWFFPSADFGKSRLNG